MAFRILKRLFGYTKMHCCCIRRRSSLTYGGLRAGQCVPAAAGAVLPALAPQAAQGRQKPEILRGRMQHAAPQYEGKQIQSSPRQTNSPRGIAFRPAREKYGLTGGPLSSVCFCDCRFSRRICPFCRGLHHWLGLHRFGLRRTHPLHNQGHAPVRRVERPRGHSQHLVSVAAHFGHLIGAHPVVLHQAPCCVGAVL